MASLPFALVARSVLDPEPRALFEEGVVFGVVSAAHDPRAPPLLSVAWLHEPAGVTLEDVVEEDLARFLSAPEILLVDRAPVRLGGVDGERTFSLHIGPGGLPTASEQWRLLAGGRRWAISAMTALGDQPEWGPRLAEVAMSFRVR